MEDFEQQLESLFDLTHTSKISELSEALGISPVTIRTWRTRNKIPASAFRKAKLPTRLTDEVSPQITIDELKNSLMEGLFTAIQVRAITLADDAKIGLVADILIKEITENHQLIFSNKDQKTG